MKPTIDDEGKTPAAHPAAERGRVAASFHSRVPCLLSSRVSSRILRVVLGAIPAVIAAAAPASASDNLNLQPDPPILIGLIVGFVVLIAPTNALIFKPIFLALDERKARIEGARNRARQIQRDADTVLSDYEERIREARAEADVSRKEQIAEARDEHGLLTATARSEAETQIEEARQTLASDLVTARESMRAEAQGLARSAAEQILGRSIS